MHIDITGIDTANLCMYRHLRDETTLCASGILSLSLSVSRSRAWSPGSGKRHRYNTCIAANIRSASGVWELYLLGTYSVGQLDPKGLPPGLARTDWRFGV